MASLTKDNDLRSFDVPESVRHSNGYTAYKIVLHVTPKELTENSYQLIYWKRYSDIRKLYDTLCRYHHAIYRPETFPSFPQKSGYLERFNPAIIEERRVATKEFLNFAVKYLYLRTHDAYINFFQNGEKVCLSNVEAGVLKPELLIPQQVTMPAPIESPALPAPVEPSPLDPQKDELLLNVDEEESTDQTNKTPKILDELSDLQFETNDECDILEIEPTDLVLTPSNINSNDST